MKHKRNLKMNNLIKKIAVTGCAVAAIALTSLSMSASEAEAGWGKKKFRAHFRHRHHYNYNYNYKCRPDYRRIWVWSPKHGRKIKRLVRVGKWCADQYYSKY